MLISDWLLGGASVPRSDHIRRHRLRVQAQQLQHGSPPRCHVGGRPDCHSRCCGLHQDTGNFIGQIIYKCLQDAWLCIMSLIIVVHLIFVLNIIVIIDTKD